jgi:hypothetical protein
VDERTKDTLIVAGGALGYYLSSTQETGLSRAVGNTFKLAVAFGIFETLKKLYPEMSMPAAAGAVLGGAFILEWIASPKSSRHLVGVGRASPAADRAGWQDLFTDPYGRTNPRMPPAWSSEFQFYPDYYAEGLDWPSPYRAGACVGCGP